MVVSIDLANASAARAFALATESVTGRATHRVEGGPGGLPEEVFRQLVVDLGITAAPVVEGYATLDAAPPRPHRQTLPADPLPPTDRP